MLIFFIFFISLSSNVLAQEALTTESEMPPNVDETFVDLTHKNLSTSLFYLSNKLDSFFGGEREENLPNASRLRLFWVVGQEEGVVLKGVAAVRLNLVLSETEKKLKISYRNNQEKIYEQKEIEKLKTDDITNNSKLENSKKPEISPVKDLSLSELLRWRIKIQSGVRIDLPPDPFIRVNILKNWNWYAFEIKPSQQFFWFLKNGLGETTKLDLDHPISENSLFRFENDVTWLDNTDTFTFFSGPTLLNKINERSGIIFSAKVLGESKPILLVSDYRFDAIYRKQLYKEWFFVEINPFIHFPRTKEWESSLGFNLRFELVVGHF